MIFFFFLLKRNEAKLFFPPVHVHECLFCLQTGASSWPYKEVKAKAKGETGCSRFLAKKKSYWCFLFMPIFYRLLLLFMCFVCAVFFFLNRRYPPSPPPSKKARGLCPRNTIDKFFRWHPTQEIHPHLNDLKVFLTECQGEKCLPVCFLPLSKF